MRSPTLSTLLAATLLAAVATATALNPSRSAESPRPSVKQSELPATSSTAPATEMASDESETDDASDEDLVRVAPGTRPEDMPEGQRLGLPDVVTG